MNMEQWKAARSPHELLSLLQPWSDHRLKLQRYVCAWHRCCWDMLNEPSRRLIEYHEQSEIKDEAQLERLERDVIEASEKEFHQSGESGLYQVGQWLIQQLRLEHLPGWVVNPDANVTYEGTEEARQKLEDWKDELEEIQTKLLRSIFKCEARK